MDNKRLFTACGITAAICITFFVVFYFLTRQTVPDHSAYFNGLELENKRVRGNEIIMAGRLDSLYKIYSVFQKQIDSLQTIVTVSGAKMTEYEKQLKAIRNTAKTNYADSLPAAILKNLPRGLPD